jgi:hypothetical protein
MDVQEARQSAGQILDDERLTPTVRYMSPQAFGNAVAMSLSPLGQRGQNPRPVSNNPGYFRFESSNYSLLASFLSRLPAPDRQAFCRAYDNELPLQILSATSAKTFSAQAR